jgi:hypothetical protein
MINDIGATKGQLKGEKNLYNGMKEATPIEVPQSLQVMMEE